MLGGGERAVKSMESSAAPWRAPRHYSSSCGGRLLPDPVLEQPPPPAGCSRPESRIWGHPTATTGALSALGAAELTQPPTRCRCEITRDRSRLHNLGKPSRQNLRNGSMRPHAKFDGLAAYWQVVGLFARMTLYYEVWFLHSRSKYSRHYTL